MPPSRQQRSLARDARQKALGMTDSAIVSATTGLIRQFKTLKPGSLDFQQGAVDWFNRMVSSRTPPVIVVHKRQIRNWDDLIKGPFPPENVVQAFLKYYVKTATSRTRFKADGSPEKVHSNRLRSLFQQFCAAYYKGSTVCVTRKQREPAEAYCNVLIAKYKLCTDRPDRGNLDVHGLEALLSGLWRDDLRVRLRQRLAVGTFLSQATQMAARPGMIVQPKLTPLLERHLAMQGVNQAQLKSLEEARKKIQGARYGHYVIYAARNPTGGSNHLLGFYTPDWSKTSVGSNKAFTLKPAPALKGSPLIWVLASLVLDGGMSLSRFKSIFQPAFLGGREYALVPIPPLFKPRLVLPTSKGDPIDSKWMTSRLKKVSFFLGFETLVRSYDMRHLTTRALKRNGGKLLRYALV